MGMSELFLKFEKGYFVVNLENMEKEYFTEEETKAPEENSKRDFWTILEKWKKVSTKSDYDRCEVQEEELRIVIDFSRQDEHCAKKQIKEEAFLHTAETEKMEGFCRKYNEVFGRKKGIGAVELTGKELLSEENSARVKELLDHFKDKQIQITTDGRNILEHKEMLRGRNISFHIVLDSMYQEDFKKRQAETQSRYDELGEQIKWLVKNGFDVVVSVVFYPEYADSYPALFDSLEEAGWRKEENITIQFAAEFTYGCDDIDIEYWIRSLETYCALAQRDGRAADADISRLLPNGSHMTDVLKRREKKLGYQIHRCACLCGNTLTFSPDGNVYLCNLSRNPESIVGTYVPDLTIDTEHILRFRKRNILNMEECLECEYRWVCRGGCPVTSMDKYDDVMCPVCEAWDEETFQFFEKMLPLRELR